MSAAWRSTATHVPIPGRTCSTDILVCDASAARGFLCSSATSVLNAKLSPEPLCCYSSTPDVDVAQTFLSVAIGGIAMKRLVTGAVLFLCLATTSGSRLLACDDHRTSGFRTSVFQSGDNTVFVTDEDDIVTVIVYANSEIRGEWM